MNPAEVYRILQLEKDYGGKFALRVEDMSIREGEVYAILGPSGAGKSTLLRLLNFLEQPAKGSINFMGHEVHAGEKVPLSLRRKVTTVFQHPVLLNRSVWANVAYGLSLRGDRSADERVWASLTSVGLEKLARQPARRLSGGEAQRVALARALLLRPDALLLDEPTANLDPYNVGLIEKAIETMNAEQGTTVVLVTHNVFQARRLAERATLLIDGRVVHTGGMEDFFQRPDHPQVKAFVSGEMVY
jgi:tungstate transport system ATP-binding protein